MDWPEHWHQTGASQLGLVYLWICSNCLSLKDQSWGKVVIIWSLLCTFISLKLSSSDPSSSCLPPILDYLLSVLVPVSSCCCQTWRIISVTKTIDSSMPINLSMLLFSSSSQQGQKCHILNGTRYNDFWRGRRRGNTKKKEHLSCSTRLLYSMLQLKHFRTSQPAKKT